MEKKEKIQIAVTAALAVVLLVLLGRPFIAPKLKAPKAPLVAQPIAPPEPAVAPESASVFEQLKEEASRLKLGRDPFNKPVGPAANAGPVLSGIVWDPREPAAIIDGQIVRIGDMLASPAVEKVVDIGKNHVILNDGTRNLELKLETEEDLTP